MRQNSDRDKETGPLPPPSDAALACSRSLSVMSFRFNNGVPRSISVVSWRSDSGSVLSRRADADMASSLSQSCPDPVLTRADAVSALTLERVRARAWRRVQGEFAAEQRQLLPQNQQQPHLATPGRHGLRLHPPPRNQRDGPGRLRHPAAGLQKRQRRRRGVVRTACGCGAREAARVVRAADEWEERESQREPAALAQQLWARAGRDQQRPGPRLP
eukprot:528804-Rhodomonas_salina.1